MAPALRKPYWAPAKWLVIIALVKGIMIGLVAASIYQIKKRYPQLHTDYQLFGDIFLALFVLAEAYACYVFRYICFSRRWAMLHVWLTGAAIVIVPLILSVVNIAFRFRIPDNKFMYFIIVLNRVRIGSAIVLLVLANAYFVTNLRRSWLERKHLLTDDIDSIGRS